MKKQIGIPALLCLAALLAACGSTETPAAQETSSAAAETEAVTEAETAVQYEEDSLPELDFGGVTVTTFGWEGNPVNEFYADETGEVIGDAIYTRNRTVEERLNVKLEYILQPGAYSSRQDWVATVQSSVMAGDGAYDIAAGYSMSGASLAYNRLVQDLTTLDYLDFSKPWWPSSLIDEAQVGGHLYFCSGDISANMILYLYGIYFNKSLLESYDLESPYQLVLDGKWTMEKLMEYSAGIYSDLDGNGEASDDDQYGFLSHAVWSDAFFYSNGLRVTSRDSDGNPVLDESFGSEKTQELIETLVTWLYSDDCRFPSDGDGYDRMYNTFSSGRALFLQSELNTAVSYLRDAQFDYGILPMPKYDEAQEEYYTVSSFPYTLYTIPMDAKDPSVSAAVLECMASESYRTVSPALFETALKVKYSSDSESAAMYDIIRESNVFDIGRIFNDSMNGETYSLVRNCLINKKTNWISTYEKKAKSLQKSLDKVVAALTEEQ